MGRMWKKLIVTALSVSLLTVSLPFEVQAAPTTQQQIDAAQQNKSELEEIMDQHEKELEGLKGEQSDLQKKLTQLNSELTTVSNQLADLEQQITDKEAEIEATQQALTEAKEKEAWQYDCMEKHIKFTYERGGLDWLAAILSAESFADILNFATYFENVASYDDRMLEQIIENREFIESEEARLEQEKLDLDILRANAEAEKSRVNGLIQQVSDSIADYADQIDDAEAAAKAYEAEMKKLEENLDYLKKKLAEEIALAQAAANAKWRDISDITFAEGDLYLLANLIYCEAGGEPYQGQVAVGSVVINRVRSEKFPDSVVGVIYQKRQFSPVASGRLELALTVNKATPSCYQAAQEAMSGVTNVGDCLFFRTPIPGLTGINIGGHVFY
ncbi:MAG: cell wall hydrolase [Lachnospiraceae bacterium]|nr:cell wall hydrolase [Lachnospiraceae bacterium]MBQ7777058.1 cell wall hydrolase [Lachnospiraceae bacterium]